VIKLTQTQQDVRAEHGTIFAMPQEFFGYCGWPTVGRMPDGTLVAVASGLRNGHVCPFGRTIICYSYDDGKTWTSPRVINDSSLDDRDAGVVPLGGDRLLVSWFTSDIRVHSSKSYEQMPDKQRVERWRAAFARYTDEAVARCVGSWVRHSLDGGETWEPKVRVPVNAPHGPIRLRSGDLLYFGKQMYSEDLDPGCVAALVSHDDGKTWVLKGTVPLYEGTLPGNYHEPHVAELPDGRLVGLIRVQNIRGVDVQLEDLGLVHFSMAQTISDDGGSTWSPVEPLAFHGSPPHLLAHSSGALICVYGYRLEPFGERAMISTDGGTSWNYDYILRSDGPDHDLGYPSSVELGDGSILTVYYQKPDSKDDQCGLLWTRWWLP
jgi:sialidase-1